MGGLFHSLGVGSEALFANRQGVDTTAHNIANAQTEGYSRQSVHLNQRDPSIVRGHSIGNGVYVGAIKRSHDKFIEKQLNQHNTSKEESNQVHKALQGFELIFSPELSATISQQISDFFGKLQTAANMPDDLTARTIVTDQARSLTASFRSVDHELRSSRDSLNETVFHQSIELTDITKQIANLNIRINEMEVTGTSQANDLHDQRDALISELAGKFEINYYYDKEGLVVIRGPGESLLVERGLHAEFDVMRSHENDGMYDLHVKNLDGDHSRSINRDIKSGAMAGILHVRDVVAKKLIEDTNQLAFSFTNEFNAIHREGFGLNDYRESTGRDFFEPIDDIDRAAMNIEISDLIANSTDAISLGSSPRAVGDNINANRLLRLRDKKILDGENASLVEFYANYVGTLGTEAVRARHQSETDNVIFADIKARKESISGVSLDEEAAEMIKWQTAFTASSKVITTVDEMLETVLGLKR